MERVPRGLCIKSINDDMSRVGAGGTSNRLAGGEGGPGGHAGGTVNTRARCRSKFSSPACYTCGGKRSCSAPIGPFRWLEWRRCTTCTCGR